MYIKVDMNTRPQFEGWFDVAQMSFTFPRLYLAGGVTTLRTGGSVQPQADLNIKRWIDKVYNMITQKDLEVCIREAHNRGQTLRNLQYPRSVSRGLIAPTTVSFYNIQNHVDLYEN